MQNFFANRVSHALEKKLGTNVDVERIYIGFFSKLIIDNVAISDQRGDSLINATRISANIDLLPLTKGHLSISSIQLFGVDLHAKKDTEDSAPNYQFLLDLLSSSEGSDSRKLSDIQIRSFIIRRGHLSYHQNYRPRQQDVFDKSHVDISGLSAYGILNKLSSDSINLELKRLSFNESSGISVNKLSFNVISGKKKAILKDFVFNTNLLNVQSKKIEAEYTSHNGSIDYDSISYEGSLLANTNSLAQLRKIIPSFPQLDMDASLSMSFNGNHGTLYLANLKGNSAGGALDVSGKITGLTSHLEWDVNVKDLTASENLIKELHSHLPDIPVSLTDLNEISFRGNLNGKAEEKAVAAKGLIASSLGDIDADVHIYGNNYKGRLISKDFRLSSLMPNNNLGNADIDMKAEGSIVQDGISSTTFDIELPKLEYDGHSYQNIVATGDYRNGIVKGDATVDDQALKARLQAEIRPSNTKLTLSVDRLDPTVLHLSKSSNSSFTDVNFVLDADVSGDNINDVTGDVTLSDFKIYDDASSPYIIKKADVSSYKDQKGKHLRLRSDFGFVNIDGEFEYASVVQSLKNMLYAKLPTFPGIEKTRHSVKNDFTVSAQISDTRWAQRIFGIPINTYQPIRLRGKLRDEDNLLNLSCTLPSFTYSNSYYENGTVDVAGSDTDTLKVVARIDKIMDNNDPLLWEVRAAAADNHLTTQLHFLQSGTNFYEGNISTDTNFYEDDANGPTAHMTVHTSDVNIGDSIWQILPSDIIYSDKHLVVDHFAIRHGGQHLTVNGVGSIEAEDSINVDIQGVDVAYIMNLINFHSVKFSGSASGKGYISSLFQKPQAKADLEVEDFRFQNGRMGKLHALAHLNHEDEQIDIDAVAADELGKTIIKGYVSPQHNNIDLNISADNTRLEFVESFCKSFMRDVDVRGTGHTRVAGDLKHINLTGLMIASGRLSVIPLNTAYRLQNDTIRMIPNEIIFERDSIFDHSTGWGIVTGSVHHNELKNVSYDIHVRANNLLALDTNDDAGDVFYGTAYATGTCDIHGDDNDCVVDADAVPEKGSVAVYNAASPDIISNQEFVHWTSPSKPGNSQNFILADGTTGRNTDYTERSAGNMTVSDFHMNLLIHANTNATLRVIMDNETGDYIALNGTGALRATYYNKGRFDLYGNYLVDHGIYKLTIQNIIKKDFQFQEGGTIAFGGEPYDAALNLMAQYTVNGVPLSDLQLGRSFTSNNIRVDCQMNITGTPEQPHVDFSLDLPTIGNDAKQMIYSLINSEEEMNQQVLYLLAIGRFYNQGANNAVAEGTMAQSQTSLAMQSLLSGTISQQINNVLSSMINNQNWNFGASITTGDEGFYNAEYEGLLQGRLLDNRLIFNGQFGYRDNPNATSSFIGDFDLRYLLYPSGGVAVRVYNQTNDRYFTRNSLTTQGIGLILKKDFRTLSELLKIRKRKSGR